MSLYVGPYKHLPLIPGRQVRAAPPGALWRLDLSSREECASKDAVSGVGLFMMPDGAPALTESEGYDLVLAGNDLSVAPAARGMNALTTRGRLTGGAGSSVADILLSSFIA